MQVAQSMKSHAPLVEKAAGIFINRLCHAKEVSGDTPLIIKEVCVYIDTPSHGVLLFLVS